MLKKTYILYTILLLVLLGICALAAAGPFKNSDIIDGSPESKDANAANFDQGEVGLNIGMPSQSVENLIASSKANKNKGPAKVPEPATLFLLGAGLIGVTAGGRRKLHNH